MVQYAVADSCLVNMPLFRIANIKTGIQAMPVCFILELPVQLKDILLKMPLELHYIRLLPLVAFKSLP